MHTAQETDKRLRNRMLNQTLTYLDHFARFTQKENVEAVERLLSTHKNLAKFERAQLGMSKQRSHLLSALQEERPNINTTCRRLTMLREPR